MVWIIIFSNNNIQLIPFGLDLSVWTLSKSNFPFNHVLGDSQENVCTTTPPPSVVFPSVAILVSCPGGPMVVWPSGFPQRADKGIWGGLEHIDPYSVLLSERKRAHTRAPGGNTPCLSPKPQGEACRQGLDHAVPGAWKDLKTKIESSFCACCAHFKDYDGCQMDMCKYDMLSLMFGLDLLRFWRG